MAGYRETTAVNHRCEGKPIMITSVYTVLAVSAFVAMLTAIYTVCPCHFQVDAGSKVLKQWKGV